MTECNQDSFEFEELFSRQVVARFDGGTISSDAGGLLLRETDRRIRLLKRLRDCFRDGRNPARVEHGLEQMLAQRIYALALGYEDLNDHEQLREDPLLAVLTGKSDPTGQDRKRQRDKGKPLAGKSTLNRLEHGIATPDRYKKVNYDAEAIDRLLVDLWLEAHTQAPRRSHSRSRHHGCGAAWAPGEPLLPWLLQPLLLFATLHFLRGASAVCAPAAVQPRCFRG